MSKMGTVAAWFKSPRGFVEHARQSVLYRKATAAIRALAEAEGTDHATRAYAEATWDLHREAYGRSRKLTLSSTTCIQRLNGKRCKGASFYQACTCHPPADDHPSCWNRDGKLDRYLSQPYSLSTDSLREIMAFVEHHELDVIVTPWPSFHFPGSVLSVEYRRRDGRESYLNDPSDGAQPAKVPTDKIYLTEETPEEDWALVRARQKAQSEALAPYSQVVGDAVLVRLSDIPDKSKETGPMPPYVKLFRSGEHLAVQTNCTTEHDFISQFTMALATVQPQNEGRSWLAALRGWIPQGFEILAKLRGYKSDVQEERVLLAGNPPLNLEALIVDSSEVPYTVPALQGETMERADE